jgi:FixJ family two-component response regulator
VLDLMMPQVSGLELQARLRDRGIERPILFLTGHGDIPTAVRALKGGAAFLTKPVTEDVLIAAIVRALQADLDQRRAAAARQSATDRVATLTPRERQVLALVVTGLLNKQIAGELGMAVKTVKVHRGRVMAKLGVRSVSELVRIAEQTGIVLAGRG